MKRATSLVALAVLALLVGALGAGCSSESAAEGVSSSEAIDSKGESAGVLAARRPIVAKPPNRPAGVPAHYVATPVGYLDPSCLVHVGRSETVGDDSVIRSPGGAARTTTMCNHPRYDSAGHVVTESPTVADVATPDRVLPQQATSDIEGWSLADFATYKAGVSHLSVSWVVPPTPAEAGQVLFFFPGTQPLDGKPGGTILQPVLAYENAQWFAQSWNCCEGNGNAEYGDSVPVNPGDTISGTMVGTSCHAGTGICDNWTVQTTDVDTGQSSTFATSSFGHPQQWIFAGVLEAYSLKSCSQLPASGSMVWHDFQIQGLNGANISIPSLSWTDQVDQNLTGCGAFWGGSQTVSTGEFVTTFGGSTASPASGSVQLVAPFSGECLDVNGSGTTNGTKIQEWPCNGSGAQTFHFASAGSGEYHLVNDNSGKCLDVSAAGTANGTLVQLYDCNGTGAQAFSVFGTGNGSYNFVNVDSGKCVDITASSTASGTQVQLWDCNGSGAQAWQIQPR
ncbi:MAG TPA: RICIN domain-containing protein [Polyangiaceae bacterium]|jgi:hypothetical protein